jgi:transcription antitermination factor NusG
MKREWYVLHVKPRTEKKVMTWLAHYGYFRYLPLLVKVTKVQRRKVRRELPLFPGYVFTCLTPDNRVLMLQTNLIVRTIPVPDPRELVHQLRQIRRVTKAIGTELKKLACTYKAGDYVRVKQGAFHGMEGYVKYDGDQTSICLNVEILGTAVEVNISPADIEKIKRSAGTQVRKDKK